MFMDTTHPRFSMDMELLCCLPLEPASASMSTLAQDLGLQTHADVRDLVAKLRGRGHEIATGRSDRGNAVSITRRSWTRSTRAAQQYWDDLYGSRDASSRDVAA